MRIILILFSVLTIGCGPSAEEKAAEQFERQQRGVSQTKTKFQVVIDFCDCRESDTVECLYSHAPTNNDIELIGRNYDVPKFSTMDNGDGVRYLYVCNIRVIGNSEE